MKGQMIMQLLLIALLAIAGASSIFILLNRMNRDTLSTAEKIIIYPKEPPQIAYFECHTGYGYVYLYADNFNGKVNFQIKDLKGNLVNDSSLTVNITNLGGFYFNTSMNETTHYILKLYTPNWSVSDSCNVK